MKPATTTKRSAAFVAIVHGILGLGLALSGLAAPASANVRDLWNSANHGAAIVLSAGERVLVDLFLTNDADGPEQVPGPTADQVSSPLSTTGACCVDGVCYDNLTEAQCIALCGSWRGAGTFCRNLPLGCPQHISGECCILGVCYDTYDGPDSCRCAGGHWVPLPIGGECDETNCPPVGACCVDGVCYDDLTEAECLDLCGSWQGAWTRCVDLPLGCPLHLSGECCILGVCYDTYDGPDSCRCAGGHWVPLPIGGECDETNCPPVGACCVDGVCYDDLTEAECLDLCGSWQGAWTRCVDLPLGCPAFISGECCILGVCYDTFAGPDSCACAGGYWVQLGIGQECDETNCPPVGACCIDGLCYDDLTEAECVELCGSWQGAWTHCDDPFLDCPDYLYGRCCIEGICYDTYAGPNSCGCDGGTWIPLLPGQTCLDVTCP
ncbi:MAG: hypothetical protein PVJ57_12165 [Phycisphaerae bacterium]|jgi:hypothetical protein